MKLAALFSDHMVLQRDQPAPVWGWAAPGTVVTVAFAGQRHTATAGADRQWLIRLDPMPASIEPRELLVTGNDGASETIRDVLVGDVWLASGQSNMQWRVGDSLDPDAEIAAADYPLIRLFTVPNRAKADPSPEVEANWRVCSPRVIWSFSAVAYFFGREMLRQTGVPVGLVNSSWGGTRIEAWTSREALLADDGGRRVIGEYEAVKPDAVFANNPAEWLRGHVVPDPGNGGFAQGWAAPGFDDSAWAAMDVPHKWQDHGHAYSGVFWFRRTVDVPDAWAGRDLMLGLGACDKHDTTYFNGEKVGAIGWEIDNAWCTHRIYRIPGSLVRPGRNTIATRIYSYMTDGGLIGPPEAMKLSLADDDTAPPIPLTGDWRFLVEHNFGPRPAPVQPLGPGNPNTPHILYDNMIRLLAPAALRGVIWYQGESNAAVPWEYRTLFTAMIRDWRRTFAQPALPFYFVQLANYQAAQTRPVESGWAELREAQVMALREPATGMAVAIDIGDAQDIHPKNKQEVGRRLALAVSGRSGPLYRAHSIEGGAIRITFDGVSGGLKTLDGKAPATFAITGADGKFEWAEARIESTTVLVSSPLVPTPAAVRYAWASNPPANLCDGEGLPASPFRTDPD